MPAVKARFYDLSKRNNSTKRPADDEVSIDFNIVFKRPTNIMEPVIVLDTNGVYPDFVYCVIEIPLPEVGEDVVKKLYYFVTSIDFSTNNNFEIRLKLDTLATAKDDILASTAFVMYSSSNFNRWLKDERIPIVIKDSVIVAGHSSIINSADSELVFESSATNETVILSAISADKGLMHYVIDEDILQDIAASLCGADISGFLDDLMQQFGDAVGSIIQIRRIPVNKDVLASVTLGTIYLGGFEVTDRTSGNPIEATYLASTMVAASGSIGVPLTYTDFRYTEPYCTAKMSLPFVGVVDISISDFPDGSIYWKMALDVVSGTIIFSLYNTDTNAKPVATFSGECGMLIPIASAQIANTGAIVTSAAGSVAGLVGGAATGNPAALVGGVMGIAQAFTATLQKTTSVIGSYSGNRSEFFNTEIRIMVEKYNTALEPADLTDIEGRPCCKVLPLQTLTGYCRTEGFKLAGHYIKDIKDEVNALMDSGIYIE